MILSVYSYMTKGKKIYTLEIVYNDKTNEIVSIYETIDKADNNNAVYDSLGEIDESSNLPLMILSDYIDDEHMELISDCTTIGFS